METVKLNLVNEGYSQKKGDASIVQYADHIGLVWCCLKCGEATSTANGHRHVFNKETNSLSLSIVHAKELRGCGYHGWLTNGIFTNV